MPGFAGSPVSRKLDESVVTGDVAGLDPVGSLELAITDAEVLLNRVHAQEKLLRNLLRGQPDRDELQDLTFAFRKFLRTHNHLRNQVRRQGQIRSAREDRMSVGNDLAGRRQVRISHSHSRPIRWIRL